MRWGHPLSLTVSRFGIMCWTHVKKNNVYSFVRNWAIHRDSQRLWDAFTSSGVHNTYAPLYAVSDNRFQTTLVQFLSNNAICDPLFFVSVISAVRCYRDAQFDLVLFLRCACFLCSCHRPSTFLTFLLSWPHLIFVAIKSFFVTSSISSDDGTIGWHNSVIFPQTTLWTLCFCTIRLRELWKRF